MVVGQSSSNLANRQAVGEPGVMAAIFFTVMSQGFKTI